MMENEPHTLTFDEVDEYLNEVAQGIPDEIFKRLNGGIVLRPDTVVSPNSLGPGRELYTLGMYYYEPYGMGRYIAINYGSFVRVHGRAGLEQQKKALKDVLYHELTHHLESMAGVRDLVEQDRIFLDRYKGNE